MGFSCAYRGKESRACMTRRVSGKEAACCPDRRAGCRCCNRGRRTPVTMPRKGTRFLPNKNGRQPCQDFFHDGGRNPFQLTAGPRPQIQGTGLVATNHPRGARTAAIEGHGKSGSTDKIASAGNRQDNRNLRHPVERVGRNDQHRASSLLLMTFPWANPERSINPRLPAARPHGHRPGQAVANLAAMVTSRVMPDVASDCKRPKSKWLVDPTPLAAAAPCLHAAQRPRRRFQKKMLPSGPAVRAGPRIVAMDRKGYPKMVNPVPGKGYTSIQPKNG